MSAPAPSLGTILRSLISDATFLARQELRLVRAELSEKAAQAQRGAISIVSGMLLGLAALMILLQAVVVALSNIMPPSIAALIVGSVVAIVAFVLIKMGQETLKPENLKPKRTISSVREHKEMVTESMK